jgi:hypothetical protein
LDAVIFSVLQPNWRKTAAIIVMASDLGKTRGWSLARIIHHEVLFCTSGGLARVTVPSGGIGARQLMMQRVRG